MGQERVGIIGIVGAGAKGREIAVYALLGGCRVVLEDMSSARLAEATEHVSASLRAAIATGQIHARLDQISANCMTSQSVGDVSRSADLLIEAAPEDAELQLEIFTILDKFAKPQAILASTAQSVSITDLAEITNCPERCVGLRFSAPSAGEKTLKIVATSKTNDRTLGICSTFACKIGFEPEIVIEVADPAASAAADSRP